MSSTLSTIDPYATTGSSPPKLLSGQSLPSLAWAVNVPRPESSQIGIKREVLSSYKKDLYTVYILYTLYVLDTASLLIPLSGGVR